MAYRKWKKTKVHPGTARPGNMLSFFPFPVGHPMSAGCSFISRMPKEHEIHVLLGFAKQTGKRNKLGLIVAPQANLGWVDFHFGCSTLCLVLPGLMGNWQIWLSIRARWWNLPNQSQPNPGSPGDVSPRTLTKIPTRQAYLVSKSHIYKRQKLMFALQRMFSQNLFLEVGNRETTV